MRFVKPVDDSASVPHHSSMGTTISTASTLTTAQVEDLAARLSTEDKGRLLWGGYRDGQSATEELHALGLVRVAPEHGGVFVLTTAGADVRDHLLRGRA